MLGFIEDALWLFEWKWEQDENGKTHMMIPETNSYRIDLGWVPDADFDGEYLARLYWDGEERVTVDQISSKDRFQVRDKIEYWMNDICVNYQEAHSRFLK